MTVKRGPRLDSFTTAEYLRRVERQAGDRTAARIAGWLASGAARRLSPPDLVINAAIQCALDPADVARVLGRDRR